MFGGHLFVARGEFNDGALPFLIVAVSAEDDGALWWLVGNISL